MGDFGLKAEKGYADGIHVGLSLSPYLCRSVMPFKSLHLNTKPLELGDCKGAFVGFCGSAGA